MIKKQRNKLLLLLIFLISSIQTLSAQDDNLWTKDKVIERVRKYHPIISSGRAFYMEGRANVMRVRGLYDPTLDIDANQKTFNGSNYYNYLNPELNIPIFYGIEAKAGIEENYGTRMETELTPGKSSYAGIKVTANGLWYDRRTGSIRQANRFADMNFADWQLTINNVMYQAELDYWDWAYQSEFYNIILQTVNNSIERFEFTKGTYLQGNKPAIDTIEALGQILALQAQLNAAQAKVLNSGLELSNHLWNEDGTPYKWTGKELPDTASFRNIYSLPIPNFTGLVDSVSNHPKLLNYQAKIEALNIDRRLKQQYLAPKLSLSYNVLSKGYEAPGSLSPAYLSNNNKFGINFNFPILLREGRGAYAAAGFKYQQSMLDRDYVLRDLNNKVLIYTNDVSYNRVQLSLFSQAYSTYQKLYTAENFRFVGGESSVFLVNSRETKALEGAQKLQELRFKYIKSWLDLHKAAGVLR
ncbi:MAG: TolC family protein [Bacteroidota bacterium]|nr:TolC family protein [Bacteroidota bacterium]